MTIKTYNFGDCPSEVITAACKEQCPDGYHMTIRSEQEWEWITAAVNEGIDSHLEAITERSTFDSTTGECLVHPEELHVMLRRLLESGWNQTEEQIQGRDDSAHSLRSGILTTLDIEEI